MRFFKIDLKVSDTFDKTKIYSPREIIGADTEEIAIALARRDWVNNGYNVLEIWSCEETYPEAVFCSHIITQGEVERWVGH